MSTKNPGIFTTARNVIIRTLKLIDSTTGIAEKGIDVADAHTSLWHDKEMLSIENKRKDFQKLLSNDSDVVSEQ